MKKILSLLITALILFTSLTSVHCEDDIKVLLDGNELAFDVPPQIADARTLVPMRAIFEALGAEVEWYGDAQVIAAEKGDTFITMKIGEGDISVNSEVVKLDVPPQIIDGRTLVPIRAVSESLDCDVQWDGENRVVSITSPESSTKPIAAPSFPIEYDDTEERKAHYARYFTLTDVERIDGGYKITYSVKTFLEGRGTVAVTFDCYDAYGNRVDSFGGAFVGTDYTWSEHIAEAVISDKTVKITLRLEK